MKGQKDGMRKGEETQKRKIRRSKVRNREECVEEVKKKEENEVQMKGQDRYGVWSGTLLKICIYIVQGIKEKKRVEEKVNELHNITILLTSKLNGVGIELNCGCEQT